MIPPPNSIQTTLYTETKSPDSAKSVSESKTVKKWNHADTLLYQHFNKTFWKKVENYGLERMERDKIELSKVIEFTISDCYNGTTHDEEIGKAQGYGKIFKPNDKVELTWQILRDDRKDSDYCKNLARTELAYLARIKQLQGLWHGKKQGES